MEIEVDVSQLLLLYDADHRDEIDKHRQNIRTILYSSNATPIGRYSILGYHCCFCPELFPDPTDLKKHTLDQHNEENIANFMENHTMLNYIVKLDITRLKCTLCDANIKELNDIIDHLVDEHDKYFFNDIDSHIVPFRFDRDDLQCVVCGYEFNNFKILLEHMNSHYGNHVCEVCDAGFVTRRMLQGHASIHKIGEFQCSYCAKIFDTRIKMRVHERNVHLYVKKRSKCGVCGRRYKTFQNLIKHEAQAHGLDMKYTCDVCERIFKTKNSFTIHMKYCCSAGDAKCVDQRRPRKSVITVQPKGKRVKKMSIIRIVPQNVNKLEVKKKNEVDKHKENIRTILLYSNATPIGRYGGIGYSCCFCTQQFASPTELKKHTIKEHEECKSIFMENRTMASFIVKLDISNLKCQICTDNIKTFGNLVEHLKRVHGKIYHENIKNHIVPFKFDGDSIECVNCGKEFNNFKILLEHMNSHYGNFVCDICGHGFVNKKILQTHAARHKTGVFVCSSCPKVFDTKIKQKDHERTIHVCFNMRSKCGYCGEYFTDYTKKNSHEVKMHGAKPVVLNCLACDKVFSNQRSLTVHKKTYHMMERRATK